MQAVCEGVSVRSIQLGSDAIVRATLGATLAFLPILSLCRVVVAASTIHEGSDSLRALFLA